MRSLLGSIAARVRPSRVVRIYSKADNVSLSNEIIIDQFLNKKIYFKISKSDIIGIVIVSTCNVNCLLVSSYSSVKYQMVILKVISQNKTHHFLM